MLRTARDERFWDKLARKYASDPIRDMPAYEKTLARTRSYLRGDDSVFEFACGTGTTALKLAPHVARYTATDISDGMIAIAREKAAAEGARVAFAKGTLEDMPEGQGTYDAVLAFNALHMLDDVPGALAAVRRLLKPGGLFISKTPCLGDANILIRLLVPVLQLIGKAPYVNNLTGAGLERDLIAAGFTIVERGWHGTKGMDFRPFIVASRGS